jgi:hypothetical protein
VSSIQTKLFQVVVDVTTGLNQTSVDSARANLQNQVNTFLLTLRAVDVAEVRYQTVSDGKGSPVNLYQADVIYFQA